MLLRAAGLTAPFPLCLRSGTHPSYSAGYRHKGILTTQCPTWRLLPQPILPADVLSPSPLQPPGAQAWLWLCSKAQLTALGSRGGLHPITSHLPHSHSTSAPLGTHPGVGMDVGPSPGHRPELGSAEQAMVRDRQCLWLLYSMDTPAHLSSRRSHGAVQGCSAEALGHKAPLQPLLCLCSLIPHRAENYAMNYAHLAGALWLHSWFSSLKQAVKLSENKNSICHLEAKCS